MDHDRPTLAYLNGTAPADNTAAPSWSLIPPQAVRQAIYRRIRNLRRPAGTLALPAIASTGTLYYTGALQHADTPVALALTTLIVFYDSVTAVCRTWRSQSTAAAADTRHSQEVHSKAA